MNKILLAIFLISSSLFSYTYIDEAIGEGAYKQVFENEEDKDFVDISFKRYNKKLIKKEIKGYQLINSFLVSEGRKNISIYRSDRTITVSKFSEINDNDFDPQFFSYCILKNILYFHQQKYFHGDISPNNIMFVNGMYVLIDFNTLSSNEKKITSFTPLYASPLISHKYLRGSKTSSYQKRIGDLYGFVTSLIFILIKLDPDINLETKKYIEDMEDSVLRKYNELYVDEKIYRKTVIEIIKKEFILNCYLINNVENFNLSTNLKEIVEIILCLSVDIFLGKIIKLPDNINLENFNRIKEAHSDELKKIKKHPGYLPENFFSQLMETIPKRYWESDSEQYCSEGSESISYSEATVVENSY